MSKKLVALVGLDPFKIDFGNPDYARFSEMGAGGIKGLLDKDVAALESFGFDAELVLLTSDIQASKAVAYEAFSSKNWDCILIGSGVRSIPSNFHLFETIINLVHELAPHAKICFNRRPDDSAEAVLRWVNSNIPNGNVPNRC